jgi:uracil-DNA glycosylase
MQWKELPYFESGEFQVVQEHLDDLRKQNISFNPERRKLFAALQATPYDQCKVIFVGQDPYPDRRFATGLAFSVPKGVEIPQSLLCLLKEYSRDLKYPLPNHGDLSEWCAQGVLLWNAYPSCLTGKSLSHQWPEWAPLTEQILETKSKDGVVCVFFGAVAQSFCKFVDTSKSKLLKMSHPSPLGQRFTKSPILGSGLFTEINRNLRELGLSGVNWRITDEKPTSKKHHQEQPDPGSMQA